MIYLIQAASSPCKIGKANNATIRLREFQCGHYETLTLLRTWPGYHAEEAAMHRAFSEFRIRGEWFRFVPAMLDADPAALVSSRGAPAWHQFGCSEMLSHAALVSAIDAHLAATGQSAAKFGRDIAGDPNLVRDLRDGRSPRMRLAIKIMDTIEATAHAKRPPEPGPQATAA